MENMIDYQVERMITLLKEHQGTHQMKTLTVEWVDGCCKDPNGKAITTPKIEVVYWPPVEEVAV